MRNSAIVLALRARAEACADPAFPRAPMRRIQDTVPGGFDADCRDDPAVI